MKIGDTVLSVSMRGAFVWLHLFCIRFLLEKRHMNFAMTSPLRACVVVY
ncbi:hypothetical protein BOW92_gp046 [Synechococcus phage S-WAM1]|uniref:Uncharacterized protein n=1 Tax=Synechococcus phage S-WAM1 TaxID=1815521 RepID=A0A1D8KSN0_9CAUD|nr:hypothetical protein BOW92_gp046 [Synechococcus phage S-WAM1]AOV61671.1 hypothetical protein P090810_198 [Synechococcus phage S-WAM1]